MADLATSTERSARNGAGRAAAGGGAVLGAGARPLPRRAALPSARAVVGGVLIALSALGIFVAWSRAAGGPDTSYVVARRDVPVGTRLTAADLTVLPMELPEALARHAAFARSATVVGATTIGPIKAGELVQAGDLVRRPSTAAGQREVSFEIDAARALGGALQGGEKVDLVATFGTGATATTSAVVRGALVLDVERDGSSLAGSARRSIVVRLAVATDDDAVAVTHAVDAGTVTLVRSAAAGGH
jgi:Flp pilus assembly protein CpaB